MSKIPCRIQNCTIFSPFLGNIAALRYRKMAKKRGNLPTGNQGADFDPNQGILDMLLEWLGKEMREKHCKTANQA